jgi:hypothetical protein
MVEGEEKVRENRLRRMARRQGMALVKSRTRDPRALDFGGFMLVEPNTGIGVYPPVGKPLSDLAEIETFLTGDDDMGQWLDEYHSEAKRLKRWLVKPRYREALLDDKDRGR